MSKNEQLHLNLKLPIREIEPSTLTKELMEDYERRREQWLRERDKKC